MTTDPETHATAVLTRLIVTGGAGAVPPDASAAIRAHDPETSGAGDANGVIWHLAPGEPPPNGATLCVVDGLAAAAEAASGPEAPAMVPRAEVRRAAQRFGFKPGRAVSGFSTYQLDPASVSAYEVGEADRTVPLGDWLAQAAALGFAEVWLHSPAAEVEGHGFPCAMLAKAHRLAPGMRFWVSGGGRLRRHFETAAAGPALAALVVPSDIAAEFAPGELTAAISAPGQAAGQATGRGAA